METFWSKNVWFLVKLQVLNWTFKVSYESLNSFLEVWLSVEDKNEGLLYCLNGAYGRSDTLRVLEHVSLNHPLQESRISYILRNCDMEVSGWFEINDILFPRFKNGHSSNLSFLRLGPLQHPLKDPFFFFPHPFFFSISIYKFCELKNLKV